jgi:hypothetical protein
VIQVAPGTKVYLACRPVSMRYGFDGLAAQAKRVLDADSLIPSFRSGHKPAKQPAADQHFFEPLHQRQQPMLGHVWDQLVEHAPLAEQRVRARL